MAFFHIFCIAVFAIVALADAFTVPPLFGRRVVPSIKMHFDEALQERTLVNGQLPAERYIATNRFKVRPKSMAKFEKRWADRTSRLALLEGFRFFTLLRRVAMDGDESFREDQAELGNYISLTIWENKGNFDAWRTGEAFKEAHGGGGITDFMKLVTTALFILDGGPKPAFYDSLLVKSDMSGLDSSLFSHNEGWRSVEADGETFIDPDLFVKQHRYTVPEADKVSFEVAYAVNSGNCLSPQVGSTLQRRDADKADDNFNYSLLEVWNSRDECFSDSRGPEALSAYYVQTAFFEGKLALAKDGL